MLQLPRLAGEVPATLPDGTAYCGNPVVDVLEYRLLRIRALQGHVLDDTLRERLAGLSATLCASVGSGELRRSYHRIVCRLPVRIRHWPDDEGPAQSFATMLEDIGAGGIRAATDRVEIGDRAEISFGPLRERPGSLVTAAWVVWSDGSWAGLQFAGAPRFMP